MPQIKKHSVPFPKPSKNAVSAPVTEAAARWRGESGALKEFDLKTAHNAWKERNGIGRDEFW